MPQGNLHRRSLRLAAATNASVFLERAQTTTPYYCLVTFAQTILITAYWPPAPTTIPRPGPSCQFSHPLTLLHRRFHHE